MGVKVKLYKSKVYKDGTLPVVVQVLGGCNLKKTLFAIAPDQFSEKSGRVKSSAKNASQLNALIVDELATAESRWIEARKSGEQITWETIFGNGTGDDMLLTEAMELRRSALVNEGKIVTSIKCETIIRKIKIYQPTARLAMVSKKWLDGWYYYLRKQNSHNTATKNVNAVITAVRWLKKEGYKINETALDAGRTEIANGKEKLTADELQRFIEFPLTDPRLILTRDTWLLCFYLRGLRIGDGLTLRPEEIINGRLVRRSRKRDKEMDVEILPPALSIIERYAGGRYILPWITIEPPGHDPEAIRRYIKHIESKTAIINRNMAIICGMIGIEKRIRTHSARHTYASLMDLSGQPVTRIRDILGHTKIATTQIYIEQMRKSDLNDQAARDLMDWLGK